MNSMRSSTAALTLAAAMGCGAAHAKLPLPTLTDEQKAAAEVAKAKAAHQGKVEAFLACKAAERAAAHYFKTHPQAVKPANAPTCVDPGPFAPSMSAGTPAAPASPAAAAAKKS